MTGMLKPSTDPVDGIFNPEADWREFLLPGAVRLAAGLPDHGPFVERSITSHRAQLYSDFKHRVAEIMEPSVGRLCGFEQPWCLPRSLLRCSCPVGETTPVPYDQIFLRAGPPTSITGCVPLGDVGVKGGGLIYLEGASRLGMQYENDFEEANRKLSEERISAFNRNMMAGEWLDRNAGRFGDGWKKGWLVGDYEAGDVVFHTPTQEQSMKTSKGRYEYRLIYDLWIRPSRTTSAVNK